MRNIFWIILVLTVFSACSEDTPEKVIFTDLFDADGIDSVEVINNQGRHLLTKERMLRFTSDLQKLELQEKKHSYKMGGIGFTLFVKGAEIPFSGRTHGEFFEVNAGHVMKNNNWVEGDWICFRTDGMNLDNY